MYIWELEQSFNPISRGICTTFQRLLWSYFTWRNFRSKFRFRIMHIAYILCVLDFGLEQPDMQADHAFKFPKGGFINELLFKDYITSWPKFPYCVLSQHLPLSPVQSCCSWKRFTCVLPNSEWAQIIWLKTLVLVQSWSSLPHHRVPGKVLYIELFKKNTFGAHGDMSVNIYIPTLKGLSHQIRSAYE